MSDLQIGLVGVTGRGWLATYAHQPGQGSRIAACCDIAEDAREIARQRFGPDTFVTSSLDELLAQDLDAIFITTPDFLHEEMAVATLEAGKPVLLEKPMAITTAGCDRILETAARLKGKLYIGHNMRHMPFVVKMRELILEGAIGEVKAIWCRHFVGHGGDFYFNDWHAERRYGTSLLLQKAAHDIDILHWLSGGYGQLVNALGGLTLYGDVADRADLSAAPPRSVSKQGELTWPPQAQTGLNANMDVEDLSMLQMRLDNGVFASYQQCHYTPDYWRNYTVIGTHGRIENYGNVEEGAQICLWNSRTDWKPYGDAQFPIERPEGGHGGADPRLVAEFLRYVREGGTTQTSPLAARYSVAVGCAATDSLRDGGTPRQIAPVSAEVATYFAN
jgi:predicted dehydrogenase